MSAMKPEIEHPVGFIEHQRLRMAHVEHVLLEVVDQASGRADEHVDAVLELPALLVVVNAAVNHRLLEPGVTSEDLGIVMDLDRQLACRGHDQRPNGGAVAAEAGAGRVSNA